MLRTDPASASAKVPVVHSAAMECTTPEALACFVRDTEGPLAVEGAGTKAGIGFAVEGRAITTRGLQGITYFEPQEFVLGALAGTRLSVLESELAKHDLILPFSPPRFGGDPSVGGIVATNLGGAERESLGAPRDNVLGAQYINGRGELLKAGGRVVKNVSGYDLSRALCGSWGTLAILTEITIKVVPKARAVAQDEPGLDAVWACPFVWRVSLPRNRAGELLNSFSGPSAQQWSGALLWLGSHGAADDIHARAAGLGGHALLVQSPADYRADHGCFQPLSPGVVRLQQQVKAAFDPEHRFNPGRMYKDL